MSEWVHNRNGRATLIYDSDCFRDNRGKVIAWISGNSVYTLRGKHCGWFEDGVLTDSRNKVLGFLRNSTGSLPSGPGLGGTPDTPGFAGRPGRPGFSGTPGRPGRGGWSEEDLASYFNI